MYTGVVYTPMVVILMLSIKKVEIWIGEYVLDSLGAFGNNGLK